MNEARKEEGRAVRAGQTQMEKLCLGEGRAHSLRKYSFSGHEVSEKRRHITDLRGMCSAGKRS